MKKIKVLHLTSTRYGIGGVEKLLLDMSDKYDTERFDVSYCNLFCDTDGAGAFPSELRKRGLKLFEVSGKRWSDLPGILKRLVKIMRSERFDVVHLHMMQATIVGIVAAILAGRRKIVTKHYTNEPSHSGKGTPITRRLMQSLDLQLTKSADCVAAVSDYVRRALLEAAVPTDRVRVVYNGIDLAAFDRESKTDRSADFPEGTVLIGTVGSLTQRKSQGTLIDAFSEIVQEHPQCRLVIVGEGPELSALQERCDRLGIVENVYFAGFRKDVPGVMKDMEIYVQPSSYESFGIVLLEAMAARKPVIATAVGGMPEIVADGESGFLVPHGDTEAISNALRELIDDKDLRVKMGETGRTIVSERFLIEHTVGEYQNLYLQLSTS